MKQLEKYLGDWGKYQSYVYAILFIAAFNCGIQSVIYSFTVAIPNVRCKLNENDTEYNVANESDWNTFYYTSSANEGTVNAYCKYCDEQNCTESVAKECDLGYAYDTSQYHTSMAIDYEMVCQGAWKAELTKSLFMVGILLGATIFGMMADKIGRKTTFCISSALSIVSTNVTPLIYWFEAFCVIQVFNGALIYGPFLCGFILIIEMSSGVPRTIAGLWWQGYFSVGMMFVGLMAYLIRDWRYLMWACSAASLFYLPMFWLLNESFRWLAVKGKTDKAVTNFNKIMTFNSVYVPDGLVREQLSNDQNEDKDIDESGSVIDLFRNGFGLARTTLIVCFTWLAVSMCYYGLSLNASDLPGNVYVNFVALALVELPAYVFGVPMMEKWGRRPALVITMGIGGITLITSGFLPKSLSIVITVLALVGKMCVAGAFGIIYNYSAEVFPTVVRNSATGCSSMCARIGSLSAPFIHLLGDYYQPWIPVVIYGTFAFTAAVLDIMLPETNNRPLPNTIQDGINYSNKYYLTEMKKELMVQAWSTSSLTTMKPGSTKPTDNDVVSAIVF